MAKRPCLKHYWTKEEIKKMIKIWDDYSLDQICEELDLERSQIVSMARQIRKEGYELTSKKKNGVHAKMIKEVLSEIGVDLKFLKNKKKRK